MALPVTLTCRQTDSKTANLQEMWINQSERDHEASGQTASHPATHPPTQSVGRPASLAVDWSVMSTAEGTTVDFGLLTRYATRRFSVIYLKRAASLKKKKRRRRSRKHPVGAQKQVSLSIYDEGALL